ncbi:MAG: WD repeat-containing protein jip5 [Watsoniomyces obsoletus]|nr:MAG: WD repeat-containing protein jip5 [Watsoniomyces obsoletus]
MLIDAPRVVEALNKELQQHSAPQNLQENSHHIENGKNDAEGAKEIDVQQRQQDTNPNQRRLYILGDTSYGACCVDEIAAEHIDAEVVVHYGRSCLSPTARLPVIYVFTTRTISLEAAEQTFKEKIPDRDSKILLMSDVMYIDCLVELHNRLKQAGYTYIFLTEVNQNPSSPLPNRTVPEDVQSDAALLSEYHLVHISQPPASLLLTLASRVASIHILPVDNKDTGTSPANASIALRRRYGLVTTLSNASIFGILINTLSVKNYLHIVNQVKQQIEAAGRKSYTFVVGKINPAKLANFSEIDGWVVIGCWESSLIDSKEFYKPIITPFELELVLQSDRQRIFDGRWTSHFNELLLRENDAAYQQYEAEPGNLNNEFDSKNQIPTETVPDGEGEEDIDSEPESAPPEYDLRTGRLVSRPGNFHAPSIRTQQPSNKSGALTTRSGPTDVAKIGGQISLGAQFLLTNRTWRGLGSDLKIEYDDEGRTLVNGEEEGIGAKVEVGRSGIARGYSHPEQAEGTKEEIRR